MQAVTFSPQNARHMMNHDREELQRMNNISSVRALLDEIREPSRGEIIDLIGDTCGGVLSASSCAHLADAVLALWSRSRPAT